MKGAICVMCDKEADYKIRGYHYCLPCAKDEWRRLQQETLESEEEE